MCPFYEVLGSSVLAPGKEGKACLGGSVSSSTVQKDIGDDYDSRVLLGKPEKQTHLRGRFKFQRLHMRVFILCQGRPASQSRGKLHGWWAAGCVGA